MIKYELIKCLRNLKVGDQVWVSGSTGRYPLNGGKILYETKVLGVWKEGIHFGIPKEWEYSIWVLGSNEVRIGGRSDWHDGITRVINASKVPFLYYSPIHLLISSIAKITKRP